MNYVASMIIMSECDNVMCSRPSGERLAEHLIKAVQLTGCDYTDYGNFMISTADVVSGLPNH